MATSGLPLQDVFRKFREFEGQRPVDMVTPSVTKEFDGKCPFCPRDHLGPGDARRALCRSGQHEPRPDRERRARPAQQPPDVVARAAAVPDDDPDRPAVPGEPELKSW